MPAVLVSSTILHEGTVALLQRMLTPNGARQSLSYHSACGGHIAVGDHAHIMLLAAPLTCRMFAVILQAIAGHADIQMTMNRYVYKQTSHIIDAGSRMQALLST